MTAQCAAPRPGEKLPQRTIGPFSAGELASYAEASGDSNPLHLDIAFAKSFGFPARPVHGMRILAAFEPMLADWRPDLAVLGLRGQFLTPLLEEQKAVLTARVAKIERTEAGFIALVRLVAQTESGAPALMGEARVGRRR